MEGLIEVCLDWTRLLLPDVYKSLVVAKDDRGIYFNLARGKHKGVWFTFLPAWEQKEAVDFGKRKNNEGYLHYFIDRAADYRMKLLCYAESEIIDSDGTIYQMSSQHVKGDHAKIELTAECKQSRTKVTGSKFPIKEEDIQRNVRHGSWTLRNK